MFVNTGLSGMSSSLGSDHLQCSSFHSFVSYIFQSLTHTNSFHIQTFFSNTEITGIQIVKRFGFFISFYFFNSSSASSLEMLLFFAAGPAVFLSDPELSEGFFSRLFIVGNNRVTEPVTPYPTSTVA